MKDVEFNLLDEPWIRVLCPDCSVKEVSLTQALLRAQEYTDLAGELPTQDVAVLRLLLAVLHAVFERVDAEGQPIRIESLGNAVRQWKSLWLLGRFPEQPVLDYLKKWHDRFWLFHPDRPFWQVPQAEIGINFGAEKLNGEISQSGNTERLFSSFSGTEKEALSYAAAARWLIYINGYDERGGRPKEGNKPRPGVAWLGQIGFWAIKGKNLYETLMRNFALLQDGERMWTEPSPLWEQKEARQEQSSLIPHPTDQAKMLTMQSRRVILKRENEKVIGHILLGGDYIEPENAFAEQMTIWRKVIKKEKVSYYPRQHDISKQMWREIPTFIEGREPGVMRWNMLLQRMKVLSRKELITAWVVANQYDSQGASVKDVYDDILSFNLAAFTDLGNKRKMVIDEVSRCEQLANAIGHLVNDLAAAAGSHAKKLPQTAKEQFYFEIDQPFRQWLSSIDPEWEEEETDASLAAWQGTAMKIARRLGTQLVEQAGPTAFAGRAVKPQSDKGKSSSQDPIYYAAPKAYNSFLYQIQKIYDKKGGA